MEYGAHHIDISGEPYYLEKMQLVYHKEAEEKGELLSYLLIRFDG